MIVTHLFHSGFSVELAHTVLIFDWYTGALPVFPADKKICVFASHHHPDHYAPRIWKLREQYPQVNYILDHTIRVPQSADTRVVHAGEAFRIGIMDSDAGHSGTGHEIFVSTYLSTDEGVAFLVEAEGKCFFHAGDLNIWYWKGEPEQDNKWQIGTYQAQIRKLQQDLESSGKKIDAAFLPLDPRLEEDAVRGPVCFLSQIPTEKVFPMHYENRKKEAMAYLQTKELAPYRDRFDFSEVFTG